MKLNLLIDDPDNVRSSHQNIDPYASEHPSDFRTKGDITNLDWVVDDGEAEEIIAYKVLDYFMVKDADDILKHWLKKLKKGGTLTISFVEVEDVIHRFRHNQITIEDFNLLIHGEQHKDWAFKRASFTMLHVISVLETHGYKILMKRVEQHHTYITCQRP